MVGLVDIAPAAETVSIRGQQVSVVGVSAAGVAGLLARFRSCGVFSPAGTFRSSR